MCYLFVCSKEKEKEEETEKLSLIQLVSGKMFIPLPNVVTA
jgi:hypothetical protein